MDRKQLQYHGKRLSSFSFNQTTQIETQLIEKKQEEEYDTTERPETGFGIKNG